MVDVVIGILAMTVIVHKISKPVIGSGIAIHVVLPPLLAAAVALMISPQDAPLIAYISGTIGCLIGIDILNLKKLHLEFTPSFLILLQNSFRTQHTSLIHPS